MARQEALTNTDIAELLARESERAEMPAQKALRRASRRALMWPEEVADLLNDGRSLVELQSVGRVPHTFAIFECVGPEIHVPRS